jgi:hypothetical protein
MTLQATNDYFVRFKVLMAASMKMAVIWNVAPRSLVEVTDVSEMFAASVIKAISVAAFPSHLTPAFPACSIQLTCPLRSLM